VIQADSGALLIIGGAFAAALLISLLLTPLAARFATATGAIDAPGAARRIHSRPIPRGGGVAVAASFVVVGGACFAVVASTGSTFDMADITPPEALALFGGAVAAAVLGFLDDRFQLRARWQLLMQVVLAIGAVAAGVMVDFINNPLGPKVIPFSTPFAVGFTVFWIAGMINSINWIDGLDGLSTGVALIAAVTLGLISLGSAIDQPAVALLCACLAGALAGFLPWNFHPARVFIGSAGTYFIGYTLAVLSILGTAKVAVAILVLGVPIIDTFWIIVRRTLAGQAPFTADRGHLHHRLLDLGISHRGAVLTIYALTGILAVASLVLSGSGQLYAFLGLVAAAGVLLYVSMRRGNDALKADAYDGDDQADDEGGDAPGNRDDR
jgi:UDP-GlcNAc:undecaprenyl-phosphate GlcNAc-1-phosphate transferase